jgi:hypothetical protein
MQNGRRLLRWEKINVAGLTLDQTLSLLELV